jgi:hypothetical protein
VNLKVKEHLNKSKILRCESVVEHLEGRRKEGRKKGRKEGMRKEGRDGNPYGGSSIN